MQEALIGLGGLLIGLMLNEIFRRRARIETFASRTFDKRIDVFENLHRIVRESSSKSIDIIQDEKLKNEKKHEKLYTEGMALMGVLDEYSFYISDELSVVIGMAFIGLADRFETDDVEVAIEHFQSDIREIYTMIRSESGVAEIEKVFFKINKTKHSNDKVKYFREAKRKMSKK